MRILRTAVWLGLAALAAQTIRAEGKSARPWLGNCEGDADRLCPGQKSISLCLIDHEAELSPACGTTVAGWSKKSAQSSSSWLGPCSPDAEKLCAGQHSISECLLSHKKELDGSCRKMVDGWSKQNGGQEQSQSSAQKPPPTHSSWLDACSADAERVCAGKRSVSLCMAEHQKELSPACQTFIEKSNPRQKAKPPAK